MRYIIALTVCFLFLQCHTSKNATPVEATGSYDTLGLNWMTIERSHIIYYFQGNTVAVNDASRYADEHEKAYESIDQVFKAVLPRKLRFFVWTDRALGEQLLHYTLGFTVPPQCVCYVRINQTLGHEMTHALTYWAGGVLPTAVTKFLNEGVAVAFDQNTDNKMETAKSAIAGKNIQSVADVWSGRYQASDEVLYPLAGAFVSFLYQQNLPDQFNALIKNQTIESAENIYGKGRMDSLILKFDSLAGLK